MHYRDSGASLPRLQGDEAVRYRLRHDVVSSIPTDVWYEADDYLPLRHDTDPLTIASTAFRFCTGEPRSYAVYVLECAYSRQHRNVAATQLGAYRPGWKDEVDSARRLIYVGRAKNLLKRLHQHLNEPGDVGANFTAVFPPVRILDVSWYPSKFTADRAERFTAELLRERFPDDYISQPG